MRLRSLGVSAALALLLVGTATAQDDAPAANAAAPGPLAPVPPTTLPPSSGAVPPTAGVPGAVAPANPGVLGRSRPTPPPELPQREAPRAHVSIVSPKESTVHKRSRGIRTQDGDGLMDGAAQDAPAGPNVERLE